MNYALNKVVGIGEALWDIFPQGRQLGGAPANFAYHVSQFGFQGTIVSAVGNDALGKDVIEQIESHCIASHIAIVDYSTGVVSVTLNHKGIPKYEIVENAAWDNIPFDDEMQALASQTVAVCFGTLAQRNPISRKTIRRFIDSLSATCLKVFDINLRQHYYDREIIEWSLMHCNILKLNEDELIEMKGLYGAKSLNDDAFCMKLQQLFNLKVVILTRGENGSCVYYENEMNFEPTPTVKVVDTVGAGDAFTAAFIATLLQGKTIIEAHRQAVETATITCTQKGGAFF